MVVYVDENVWLSEDKGLECETNGAASKSPMRRFSFELDLSGKNNVTTFAQEENQQ